MSLLGERMRGFPWESVLLAVVLLLSIGSAAQTGAFRELDNSVRNLGFALRDDTASGQIHVVEMDAASVAAIRRWPWPRSNYAQVVDALDAAGARSIVFDVDFSSRSDPAEDAAFARALERASAEVVLPTFGQNEGFGSDRQIDALPIPLFRPHASLASVSVIPDTDGFVRQMPLGTMTAGIPRPSLSAQAAGAAGAIDEYFPVDFAIDPATIPRHSFVAVAKGRFDHAAISGKDVIIGATAIEMGDRYATPRHGVLPGVVVQAMAAETLLGGVPTYGGWLLPLVVAALVSLAVFAQISVTRVIVTTIAGLLAAFAAYVLAYGFLNTDFQMVAALAMLAGAGTARAGLLLYRDIQSGKRLDEESGLPNRRALREADASPDARTIVAMIGNFDAIKSVIGADNVGLMMVRLGERLVRQGTIYRVDDRVLAWVSEVDHQSQLDALASLQRELHKPLEVAGRRIDPVIVFGIAAFGATAEATMAASTALASEKPWHVHEATEQAVLEQEVSLMGELDAAIEEGQLQVQYQPKLDLALDRVTSVEALVRWHHPVRGYLRPDSFIPLAEKSDRIAQMTLFVLRRTLHDLAQWRRAGLDIKAAINISGRLVASQEFYHAVQREFDNASVPASAIVFEVTESAAMADPEAALRALEGYRAMGIAISLDDYGTGQSTLTYLKTLPISELKIDRSFVEYAHEDSNDAVLVRSTVQLAHSLGLRVVAEGIETRECLDFLRTVGCDLAQGYFIAKPLKADDLIAACRAIANDEPERVSAAA